MLVRQDASPDLVSAAPSVVYREADPSTSDEFPSAVSTGHSHPDTAAAATVHRGMISPIPAQLPAASLSPAVQPTVAPTVATPAGIVHRKARTGASPHASDSAVSGLPVRESGRVTPPGRAHRTAPNSPSAVVHRKPVTPTEAGRPISTEIVHRKTDSAGGHAPRQQPGSEFANVIRSTEPSQSAAASLSTAPIDIIHRAAEHAPASATTTVANAEAGHRGSGRSTVSALTLTYPPMTHALAARSPGLPRAGYDMIFREAIENRPAAPSAPFEGFSKAAPSLARSFEPGAVPSAPVAFSGPSPNPTGPSRSGSAAMTEVEVRRLADRIYQILVRRLASEKERRGGSDGI
jgi:hypothetical protein